MLFLFDLPSRYLIQHFLNHVYDKNMVYLVVDGLPWNMKTGSFLNAQTNNFMCVTGQVSQDSHLTKIHVLPSTHETMCVCVRVCVCLCLRVRLCLHIYIYATMFKIPGEQPIRHTKKYS